MVYLLNVCILHLRVDHECKKHMHFVQHYKVNIATSASVGYIDVTKCMCDKWPTCKGIVVKMIEKNSALM